MDVGVTLNNELRVNYTLPFEVPLEQPWQQATYVRQDNVVFKWDEIDVRYRPTKDDTAHVVWVEMRHGV